MSNSRRDQNRIPALIGVSSVDLTTIVPVAVDPTTNRMLVDLTGLASHIQRDQFTATNNQTQFTATKTVVADMLVIVNGQIQSPGGGYDYSISGNILTLNQGVPLGLQVLWLYIV